MEKLIIKNFGPISDVEIALKKYIVLIGDTSTGKSVIAKLICILQECLFIGVKDIEGFKDKLEGYNIPYLEENSIIEYHVSEKYYVKIQGKNIIIKGVDKESISKIEEFVNEKLSKKIKKLPQNLNDEEKLLDEFIKYAEKILEILQNMLPLYIPAERVFFSMVGNSLAGLWANEINISKLYLNFARHYEVAKKNISKLEYSDLKFAYHREENDKREYIKCGEKDIEIKNASSGIQAILPLVIVLRDLLNKKEKSQEGMSLKTICIEEPEISLFPNRQRGLLEYIVSLIKKIDSRVIITTHSPYILSAFNNLILANNTAIEKKERKKDIEKIISEDKWINFEEVSAYEVKEGGVISLLDKEYKGIDVNAIDDVSDRISEDVDKLISIRYEE